MWGLTADQWNAIAALAQIAGAIATVAAVVVALMLGRTQTAERLSVRTGTLGVLTLRNDAPRTLEAEENYATVTITNVGMVPVHLAGIAWRDGRHDPDMDIMPAFGGHTKATLEAGTSEEYAYRLDGSGQLLNSTIADRFFPAGLIKPRFVRVSTERGHHFMARFPPPWRPKWLRRIRHIPAPVRYQLRRVDSGGGVATTYPDALPPRS